MSKASIAEIIQEQTGCTGVAANRTGGELVAAIVKQIDGVLDLDFGAGSAPTWQSSDALALNDIGRVRISLAAPLPVDPYREHRGTGSFILVDEVTGAEAGFYTHPEARGKGVLGEAFPAAVRYAFDKLGFRRLTLFAADSNEGSKKLARIAGFREFGTQKLAARSDGVFEDLVGFELFRDDYEADRKD